MPRSRLSLLAVRERALHDIATALASSLRVEEFGARATRAIVEATGWQSCTVMVAYPEEGVLRAVASTGVSAELLAEIGVTAFDTTTLTGRAALTGQPQVSGRVELPERVAGLLKRLGSRQFVITPLRHQGQVLGTLNAFSMRRRLPDDEEVAVLQAVGDLLALALHNARLHAQVEQERARARFLADVGHTFATTLDLEQVLGQVAARATTMLGEWCVIYLLDRAQQVLHMRAVHHADPRRVAIVRTVFHNNPVRVGEGIAGRVVLDRRPRVIPRFDEAAIAALAPRDDPAYGNELRQVHSWACLPLEARGEAIGALVIATTQDRAYTEDDLRLAAEFAERAALAIDNAQLYADAQRRARESDFLAETAAVLGGARTPREIVRAVARQATTMLGDACGIFLPFAGERWMLDAWIEHRDPDQGHALRAFLSQHRDALSGGPIRRMLAGGEVVTLNDATALEGVATTDAARRLIAEFGIQTMMAVAVGSRRDPLGAIFCVRQGPPPYTPDEARLLRLVAGHVGAALVSAMLNAKMEAERARLAALIETLPEGVIIATAPDGRLTVANRAAAEILGREIAGETRAEWVAAYRLVTAEGEPFPTEQLPLARALRGEIVRGVEVWVARPDGGRVPLLASAAPMYGPDGVIDEAVVIFQDITPIKEAERIKDQWLSLASHELRTPITSMRGFAQLLERQVRRGDATLSREALAAALGTISEQAGRLTALVNDLLDISRIQLGRLELRRRPLDLRAVTNAWVTRATAVDPEIRARLQLELPSDPLIADVDPDRIEQVITNLISNALKYDPRGEPITLRLFQEHGEAVLEVRDQGIGIPAAELGRLFQPFARAANAARHGFGGIGLGLYICKDIVERHGGRIVLESVERAGATFAVRLPLADACAGRPGQEPDHAPRDDRERRMRYGER